MFDIGSYFALQNLRSKSQNFKQLIFYFFYSLSIAMLKLFEGFKKSVRIYKMEGPKYYPNRIEIFVPRKVSEC